jgi:hypothetical protein
MKGLIEKYQTNTVLRADAYEWILLQFEKGNLTPTTCQRSCIKNSTTTS